MNNTAAERKLRAARSSLIVSGRGVILLSAWGALKGLLSLLYDSSLEEVRQLTLYSGEAAGIITAAIIIVVVAAIAVLYLYVGLHAMAAGHGRRTNSLYLAIDLVLAVLSAGEFLGAAVVWWANKGNFFAFAAQEAVELISFAIFTDLFLNAVRMKKYVSCSESEKGAGHAA